MKEIDSIIFAIKKLFIATHYPHLIDVDDRAICDFFATNGKKNAEYHASLSSDHPDFHYPKPPNSLPTNDLFFYNQSIGNPLPKSHYTMLMMEVFGYKSKLLLGESINVGINPYDASNMTEFLRGVERAPEKRFFNNESLYVRCGDSVVITKPMLLSEYLKRETVNLFDVLLFCFQKYNPDLTIQEIMEGFSAEARKLITMEGFELSRAHKFLSDNGIKDEIFYLSTTHYSGEREITPIFASQQVSDDMTPDEYIKTINDINTMPDSYFDMLEQNMKSIVKMFSIYLIPILEKEALELEKDLDNRFIR